MAGHVLPSIWRNTCSRILWSTPSSWLIRSLL
jgi:hypothetical protein